MGTAGPPNTPHKDHVRTLIMPFNNNGVIRSNLRIYEEINEVDCVHVDKFLYQVVINCK